MLRKPTDGGESSMALPPPPPPVPLSLRRSTRMRMPTLKMEKVSSSKQKTPVAKCLTLTPPTRMEVVENDPDYDELEAFIVEAYATVQRKAREQRACDIKAAWEANKGQLEKDLAEKDESMRKSQTNLTFDNLKASSAAYGFTASVTVSRKVGRKRVRGRPRKDPILRIHRRRPSHSHNQGHGEVQKVTIVTLGWLERIPPVVDWTAIPFNVAEEDGKFLTNIPFLGDEFIDKGKKFITEILKLYQGNLHDADQGASASASTSVVRPSPSSSQRAPTRSNPLADDASFLALMNQVLSGWTGRKSEVVVKVKTEEESVFGDANNNGLMEVDEPDPPPVLVKQEVDLLPFPEYDDDEEMEGLILIPTLKSNANAPEEEPIVMAAQQVPVEIEVETKLDLKVVFEAVSKLFPGNGSAEDIQERYEAVISKVNNEEVEMKPPFPLDPSATYSIPNIDGPYAKELPREKTMHAFQWLFCRRCYQYDCPRGHNGDDQLDLDRIKASRPPQETQVSFECRNPNCWRKQEGHLQQTDSYWDPGEKSLYLALTKSFPDNPCHVAWLMRKDCREVAQFERQQNNSAASNDTSNSSSSSSFGHNQSNKKKSRKSSSSVSKKTLSRRWINSVSKLNGGGESSKKGSSSGIPLPARFMPCKHPPSAECDERNPSCYCGKNGTCCEKYCSCPPTCKIRFPGCRCTSTCDSRRCVCFLAARECDPDLCSGCGACEVAVGKMMGSCRNVNIQKSLHKHLLMGKSDVAGWGIFIKEDVQKGEFIAEYRGEIISHDESERRGHVYDKLQHTFLFELNDHFVVDATRKGNKARFVNSSKAPNCEVKRMLVNGDHRIGIYAKRSIDAGEELFYDYEDVLTKQQRVAEIMKGSTSWPSTSSTSTSTR